MFAKANDTKNGRKTDQEFKRSVDYFYQHIGGN